MQEIEMKSRVRGRVLLPGEVGYDAERNGWNLIVEHHPAMIVVAAGPEDVAAAVRYAASADLPVAVQATGHGPSVPADGAVLINTRRMTDLEIDPEGATVRIGAGVKGGTVLRETTPHDLALLVGSTPEVGVVGYLTSGGLPMLGRRYGFAADHVRAIELVTADGELRRATAEEHPELFWATRGGKGNFGVVTSVETDLVPVSRLYGGGLFFPGAATEEVLGGWLEWTASQPEEMASSSVALRRFPDLPGVPDPVRGKFLVHVRVAYTGRPEEGERLIRPLRAMGPVSATVADMPYASIGDVHSDPAGPAPVRDRGILLRELDDEAVERIAAQAGPDTELPPGQVEIRHLGGALGCMPETPNAISHRDAAFGMNLGMLVPPGNEEQVDGIQQALIDSLRPWCTGATLPNFLGSGATQPRRVRAAYSDTDYKRLVAIKTTHDPRNLFRVNHNIPPQPNRGNRHS
jgi:FAD/FMN-containing dehydrogenase